MLEIHGNMRNILAVQFGADKTWAETAANTSAEQTATIPGLKSTDLIIGVTKPTTQAGLGVVGHRVSATDTIALNFMNNTGSGVTATAAQTYTAFIARLEHTSTDANA